MPFRVASRTCLTTGFSDDLRMVVYTLFETTEISQLTFTAGFQLLFAKEGLLIINNNNINQFSIFSFFYP